MNSASYSVTRCTASTPDWLALRLALWPDATDSAAGIAAQLASPLQFGAWLARDATGTAIGFAEAALRHDYVNGTSTSPVLFLEGLYVVPPARRRGVARALLVAVRAWGRACGCSELASDVALDNLQSQSVHHALGFEETERVVYFRQSLQ